MNEEIINLSHITKHYTVGNQTIKALQDITTQVERNEYLALMGASGSGKSTLMNILGCLDTPTSGKYVLNNEDVSRLNDNQLAEIRNKAIGFVFQTFNLLPRSTALENVMMPLVYAGMPKSKRISRAKETLDQVQLGERMYHKSNELSGGQRQRVAIARAMVNHPEIILADEPTGNLDSETSYEIMNLFSEIHKNGNTIIVVTHEEDIAQYANRIIRLIDGLIDNDILKKVN